MMEYKTGDKIILDVGKAYKKLKLLQDKDGFLTIRRIKHCNPKCSYASGKPFFCSGTAYRFKGDEKYLRSKSHWCHIQENAKEYKIIDKIPLPNPFKLKIK